jgi:hypothetical protein
MTDSRACGFFNSLPGGKAGSREGGVEGRPTGGMLLGVLGTPLSGGKVLVTAGGGWLARVAAEGAGGCCSGMICTVGLTGEARFDGVAGGASRVASDGIKVVEGGAGRGATATEGAGALGTATMEDLAPPAED